MCFTNERMKKNVYRELFIETRGVVFVAEDYSFQCTINSVDDDYSRHLVENMKDMIFRKFATLKFFFSLNDCLQIYPI